jgi:transcriptional regulator of acetoin/glycerol metabolism
MAILHPVSDPDHATRVLNAVQSSRAAVSAVAASWCRWRCITGWTRAPRSGGTGWRAELQALRAANGELLAVAAPVLDRLFGSVGLAGACVLIADIGGVVLDWRAGDADADRFEDLGLAPGASWAEAAQAPTASAPAWWKGARSRSTATSTLPAATWA